MSDPITTFFAAWELQDSDRRAAEIASAVSETVSYHDPRTPETIVGKQALTDYVAMFSMNAPGWSARVVSADTTADVTRATIAFGGPGPDGSEQLQHGQYFIESADGVITRMVGFVGLGTP